MFTFIQFFSFFSIFVSCAIVVFTMLVVYTSNTDKTAPVCKRTRAILRKVFVSDGPGHLDFEFVQDTVSDSHILGADESEYPRDKF